MFCCCSAPRTLKCVTFNISKAARALGCTERLLTATAGWLADSRELDVILSRGGNTAKRPLELAIFRAPDMAVQTERIISFLSVANTLANPLLAVDRSLLASRLVE